MMLSLMLMFVADPGLQQVRVDGRANITRIDFQFSGRPTFQAFRSESEGLLVVDVVGGQRPTGFPESIQLFEGASLKLVEHVGNRTRLLRLELHGKKGLHTSAQAVGSGIRLELRAGSRGLRVFQASGSRFAKAAPKKVAPPAAKSAVEPSTADLTVALKRERDETARLRQLVSKFRRHQGERNRELQTLEEQARDQRGRTKGKQRQVTKAAAALGETERKIQTRRQEIVKLEAAEAEAKQRLAQVAGSAKDRQAALDRLELVELAHRAEITRLLREEMDLEKGDASYLDRVAKLQLSINGLSQRQKSLETKAKKERTELTRRQKEEQALVAEQARYRRRVKGVEARLVGAKKASKAQSTTVKKLRQQLDLLDGELAKAQGRLKAESDRLKKRRQTEAKLANQAVDLRAKIAKLVRDTADREALQNQILRRTAGKKAYAKKLESDLVKVRKGAQKAGVGLAKARRSLELAERSGRSLTTELSRLKNLDDGAQASLKEAGHELQTAQARLIQLKRTVAARRKVIEATGKDEKTLKAALKRARAERRRLETELRQANSGLERSRKSSRNLATLVDKQNRIIESTRVAVDQAKQETEQALKAAAQARATLASRQAQVKAAESRAEALQKASRKAEQEAKAKTALAARLKPKKRPVPKPAPRAKVVPRAEPVGFGGQNRAQRKSSKGSRVTRVGYRPIGPERVVIHVDGPVTGKLKRVSKTTTIFEMKGLRTSKDMASLNTARFGGRIHRITPGRRKGRVRVRITHEAGLRLRSVNKKGRLEVRVQ